MNNETLKKILGACCIAAGIYLLTSKKKTVETVETVTTNKGENLVKDLICLAVKNV